MTIVWNRFCLSEIGCNLEGANQSGMPVVDIAIQGQSLKYLQTILKITSQ